MNKKMLFIGAGSMAEAIIKGILDRRVVSTAEVTVANRGNEQRLQELRERYAIQACAVQSPTFSLAMETADLLVLAMKPKDAAAAIKQLRTQFKPHHLVVSVIAGLSIETIRKLIEKPLPIIRTMPNTSSTIGLGATGISFSNQVNQEQRSFAQTVFDAIGMTAIVEEPMLDVVTGVSGSGPAYVYYLMEAMIQVAQELGLDLDTATKLTAQTIIGAGEMVKQTGELPEALRHKVTSPNGTTQAAIESLEAANTGWHLQQAVKRATARAAELGKMISESDNV